MVQLNQLKSKHTPCLYMQLFWGKNEAKVHDETQLNNQTRGIGTYAKQWKLVFIQENKLCIDSVK